MRISARNPIVAGAAVAGTAGVGAGVVAWTRVELPDWLKPGPATSRPSAPATAPAPTTGAGPRPGSDAPAPAAVSVGQLNVKNLFDIEDQPRRQDHVPSQPELDVKLGKLALTVRDAMGAPDVVALEEVENEAVLRQLAEHPALRGLGYRGLLLEGRDPRGIDTALLYRDTRVTLTGAAQLDPDGTSPSGRRTKVFTRPPLVATFTPNGGVTDAATGAGQLGMVVNHFTSQLQGTAGVRRRAVQAEHVAGLVDARRSATPGEVLVVTGDLNEGPDGPAVARLRLRADGSERLTDVTDMVPAADRYSFRRGRQRTLLDFLLVAPEHRGRVSDVRIPHINSDAPAAAALEADTPSGASDHDPVTARVLLGAPAR